MSCILQLDFYAADRRSKVAVLVGWRDSTSVIEDVRLCNCSSDLIGSQRVDNPGFRVDAQIRQVL